MVSRIGDRTGSVQKLAVEGLRHERGHVPIHYRQTAERTAADWDGTLRPGVAKFRNVQVRWRITSVLRFLGFIHNIPIANKYKEFVVIQQLKNYLSRYFLFRESCIVMIFLKSLTLVAGFEIIDGIWKICGTASSFTKWRSCCVIMHECKLLRVLIDHCPPTTSSLLYSPDLSRYIPQHL